MWALYGAAQLTTCQQIEGNHGPWALHSRNGSGSYRGDSTHSHVSWDDGVAAAPEAPPLAAAAAALAPGPAAGTSPGSGEGQGVDVRVSIVCGGLPGVLLLPQMRVLVSVGARGLREVSPTEFERLGGKGAAKKWRQTIQLQSGRGSGRHPHWII
jgi:hypothetical protein